MARELKINNSPAITVRPAARKIFTVVMLPLTGGMSRVSGLNALRPLVLRASPRDRGCRQVVRQCAAAVSDDRRQPRQQGTGSSLTVVQDAAVRRWLDLVAQVSPEPPGAEVHTQSCRRLQLGHDALDAEPASTGEPHRIVPARADRGLPRWVLPCVRQRGVATVRPLEYRRAARTPPTAVAES